MIQEIVSWRDVAEHFADALLRVTLVPRAFRPGPAQSAAVRGIHVLANARHVRRLPAHVQKMPAVPATPWPRAFPARTLQFQHSQFVAASPIQRALRATSCRRRSRATAHPMSNAAIAAGVRTSR